MRRFKLLILAFSLFFTMSGFAQIMEPVKWSFSKKDLGNNEYELVFKAKIDMHWHLYAQDIPDGGPIPTSFNFEDNTNVTFIGKVLEKTKSIKAMDNNFGMVIKYFETEAVFVQKIKVRQNTVLKGYVNFMCCDDQQCMPPSDVDFEFDLKAAAPKKVEKAVEKTKPVQKKKPVEKAKPETVKEPETKISEEKEIKPQTEEPKKKIVEEPKDETKIGAQIEETTTDDVNYWSVFIIAFLAGFAALLTPCVFPMIPMTVSFFTKQSKTKARGIRNGIWFGISIIVIYVLLGTVVSAIFGPESLNKLSTEPLFNLIFGILLLIFAFSFFGAFELVLPSSWVNSVDKKADKGGWIGIFFMAFALALVSFSCTGPILGAVIVQAATEGGIGPIIGMLGFSLALAIPFAFFAAFPGYLNTLPKSGGWLNSVKVVLAFIELAFAFKFFSMAEMVLDLHWFERELYIAIWVAIALGLSMYLWGKLRFPHDSPMEYIPVSRFMFGLVVFAFAIYMLPGMWGAPVKLISGFPPPADYAESPDGVGKRVSLGVGTANFLKNEKMHEGPHGIPVFSDYEEALKYAKEVNKPLVIDFTGKACTNCRKMEDNVWIHPEVKKIFTQDVIVASLYVDLRTKLPEDEQYISEYNGKKVRTIGQKYTDMQIDKYKRNTQPFYVFLDTNENMLMPGQPYEPSAETFLQWLKKGLEKFEK